MDATFSRFTVSPYRFSLKFSLNFYVNYGEKLKYLHFSTTNILRRRVKSEQKSKRRSGHLAKTQPTSTKVYRYPLGENTTYDTLLYIYSRVQ